MALKPCPFCGGEAELNSTQERVSNHPWFWVTCRVCKVGQPQSLYAAAEAAATAWNDHFAEIVVQDPSRFA